MTEHPKHARWSEGFVIVVSILLAFSIEAYWADFQDRREARRLLELIRTDVVATQQVVEDGRERSIELDARARHLLDVLASPTSETETEAALLTLGSVFITGGWDPVNHTYVEAVNSGRLRLIESEDLRLALTRYAAQIEELHVMSQSVETQYYGQMEPFMVANTVYSELAAEWWRESLVEAPFGTDFARLAESRELWNLVTLRLEVEVAVQSRLDGMEELAERVLDLLDAELGRGAL